MRLPLPLRQLLLKYSVTIVLLFALVDICCRSSHGTLLQQGYFLFNYYTLLSTFPSFCKVPVTICNFVIMFFYCIFVYFWYCIVHTSPIFCLFLHSFSVGLKGCSQYFWAWNEGKDCLNYRPKTYVRLYGINEKVLNIILSLQTWHLWRLETAIIFVTLVVVIQTIILIISVIQMFVIALIISLTTITIIIIIVIIIIIIVIIVTIIVIIIIILIIFSVVLTTIFIFFSLRPSRGLRLVLGSVDRLSIV